MDERIDIFNKYLVTYSADENGTGIKGIRSDAPQEVIDTFIDWYRDKNRYENGRKYNLTSKKIKNLIIDVDEISQVPMDKAEA